MLRFWRKIRKSLVEQDRLKNYMLYALGEILLVMIGILLALYVNNLNQIRQKRNSEIQYLTSLKEEFNRNKKEVERVLNSCASIKISGTQLANWSGSTADKIVPSNIEQNFAMTFAAPPKFIQSPGVLNDLISSGNLNKIQNSEIRYLLQQWFAIIKEVEDEEDELWRHRFDVVDFVNKNISFKSVLSTLDMLSNFEEINQDLNFSSDIRELLKSRYFENLLLFYLINLDSLEQNFYPQLEKNIDSIINEIDEELK